MNQIERCASMVALICCALLPTMATSKGAPSGRELILKDSAPAWRG